MMTKPVVWQSRGVALLVARYGARVAGAAVQVERAIGRCDTRTAIARRVRRIRAYERGA